MVVRFVSKFCNHENSPCDVFGSAKCPVFLVWNFKKTPKSTPGAAVLYIRGTPVRWGRRRKRRETRKFSGLDSPGGTSEASKSDSFSVFVRFLSRNVRRTVAPRPATPPRMSRFGRFGGGGKVRFFGISGFPKKSRVVTVTGGSHHGHKLVACETGVSLESLSEVYMSSAPRGRCTPREIPEKRKFSDFDSTDAPSGPPRYENSFGSVRICHCRSRLAVTPKARLLSPASIFQETCFFWGRGDPPPPGRMSCTS